MALWGLMINICASKSKIDINKYLGFELNVCHPTTSINRWHNGYPGQMFYTMDCFIFIGFISKSANLKITYSYWTSENSETRKQIRNSYIKILDDYFPTDISNVIMDYAGMEFGDTIKFSMPNRQKLDDETYLHYAITQDDHLLLCPNMGKWSHLKFDTDIIKIYKMLTIPYELTDRLTCCDYTKYYSNYVNIIEKKHEVTLDFTNKTQTISIIKMINNCILLRFQIDAHDNISHIEFNCHNIVTPKYDVTYMKYIDNIIYPNENEEKTYSISFTNGHFGGFSLYDVNELDIIFYYNNVNNTNIDKITTCLTFKTCNSIK